MGVEPIREYQQWIGAKIVEPIVNLTEVLIIIPSSKEMSKLINKVDFEGNQSLAHYSLRLGNIIKVIEDFNQNLKKYAEFSYNQ